MEQNKFVTPPPISPFNSVRPPSEMTQSYNMPNGGYPPMDFHASQRMPTKMNIPPTSGHSGYGSVASSTHGMSSNFKQLDSSFGSTPPLPPGCHPYSNSIAGRNGSHPSRHSPGAIHPHVHSRPIPPVSQENGNFYPPMHMPNGFPPPSYEYGSVNNQRNYYAKPEPERQQRVRDSFFMDSDLRSALLHQQMVSQISLVDETQSSRLPLEVDAYHHLMPLESIGLKSLFLNPILTSTFRVNHRNGLNYCMKRIHACRNVSKSGLSTLEKWKSMSHSNIVSLHEVFTTKSFQDQSLVFIYDFHPASDTLLDILFRTPGWKNKNDLVNLRMKLFSKEQIIWNFVIQLTSALRHIHSLGLASRSIDLSQILVTGKNRLRLNSIGIQDLLSGSPSDINRYQQQDLIDLGHVILSISSGTLVSCQNDNIGKALDHVQKKFSKDLHSVIAYLIFGPSHIGMQINRNRNVNDLMPLIGARFYTMVDDSLLRGDETEKQLSTALENGRLFRLLCKLGVVEQSDLGQDYETGDRYLLKLFRNYLFHQVNENGQPWLEMSHIVHNLNKLDIGSHERFLLTSNDPENVLVVSYNDIQSAVGKCFQELLNHR